MNFVKKLNICKTIWQIRGCKDINLLWRHVICVKGWTKDFNNSKIY